MKQNQMKPEQAASLKMTQQKSYKLLQKTWRRKKKYMGFLRMTYPRDF